MIKRDKSIGMTDDVKRKLLLQSIEIGISFKLHCENVLEKQSEKTIEARSSEEMPKKSVGDVGKGESILPEKILANKKVFDTSGVFKKVEAKIYSNGKCFELRVLGNEGVDKSYFGNLEDAQEAKI